MDSIQPARQALRILEQRVGEMRSSGTPDELEAAWIGVLDAFYSFYEKCRVITKNNARAKAWMDTKLNARRTDPLLRYIHHARNAETHGLDGSQKWHPGTLLLGIPGPGASTAMSISMSFDHRGIATGTVKSIDGRPISGYHAPATMHLINVKDRGTEFPVPMEHLGKPLPSKTPLDVAIAIEAYLKAMLEELAALPQ